jgi:hypothetical protein
MNTRPIGYALDSSPVRQTTTNEGAHFHCQYLHSLGLFGCIVACIIIPAATASEEIELHGVGQAFRSIYPHGKGGAL